MVIDFPDDMQIHALFHPRPCPAYAAEPGQALRAGFECLLRLKSELLRQKYAFVPLIGLTLGCFPKLRGPSLNQLIAHLVVEYVGRIYMPCAAFQYSKACQAASQPRATQEKAPASLAAIK